MYDRQLKMLHELATPPVEIETANAGNRAETARSIEAVNSLERAGTTDSIDGMDLVTLQAPLDLPPIVPSIDLPRIVLADDDAVMCEYLQQLLIPSYQVEIAADGVKAMAAIDRRQPDLVLTDVVMPNLDGLELLRSIRANPATQDIPVILLSAHDSEESRIAGLEAGADDYLVKPFSARELVARVGATLRLARLRLNADNRERALQQETDTAKANLDRIVTNLNNGFATFDRQWRYTYANNRLLEIFKLPYAAVLGKQAWEVFPNQVGIKFYDLLKRAMNERSEEQFEYYYEQIECWVEHRIYPTDDGVAILMADVSDRKRAELLSIEQTKLLELAASGKPLDECLAAVCTALSALNNLRACILLADPQRERFSKCIAPLFGASFALGIEGAPLDEQTIGTYGRAVFDGESVTCADIANDERWSPFWQDLYLEQGSLGCHAVPIIGADELPLGALMLCFGAARLPTDWEYRLADFGVHIASIVCERERKSSELRESESQYRTLFESIDEGFCIVEMLFDAQQQPVDYRLEQVNPAFSRLTELPADAVGKTVRELMPDIEDFWIETYGKIALTGESVRFEKSAPPDRWFDVYASRVGDGASRHVAIVFNNITERKQAEEISQRAAKFDAFRITLADALRPLADPVEIQATASRVLGEHLGANRVAYFEVRGAIYVVERDYLNGATPLVGNYPVDAFGSQVLAAYRNGRVVSESDLATDLSLSPAERAAYAALGLVAYIGVPLVKDGEFVAGLAIHTSTPRMWTPDDIALAEEVAERTWAALERARAQVALRESEIEYRTLFESIDEGFCIVEMLFDAQQQPVDYRLEQVNPAFSRLTELPADAVGKTVRELMPDIEDFWIETYGKIALTGESVRFEKSAPPDRWFDVYASRVGDGASRRVAIVFSNITERKQAEEISQRAAKFDAFRIALADALRPLADSVEIQVTASRVLGEYLGANRVVYFEARGTNCAIERDYVNGATSMCGIYPMDSFGSTVMAALRNGQSVSAADVAADADLSPVEKAAYATAQIGAYFAIPLVKGSEFVAGLAVHMSEPREWTPDDLILGAEVAERTWAALERARTEVALQKSEAKYRTLFESIDEGYVLMEMLFDATDRPIDFRYLDANPAAVTMLGGNPIGQRGREFLPSLEGHWFETLGRVAQTGIGERHELEAALMNAWYNFYVFKIDNADSRQVAIIFEDITARKRREANTAFLTAIQDDFAQLITADEIMQAVGEKLSRYLDASQCLFTEIDEAQDRAIVEYNWHSADTLDLVGTYQLCEFVSAEFYRAARARETIVVGNTQTDARTNGDRYAAFNVHAFVNVPFHRGNNWKYLLTINDVRSRDWREDEIELIDEVANRLFPRIERARAEAEVAANLHDTQLLRELGARLVSEDDSQTLYGEILAAAIDLTGADAGTLQILDEQRQDLCLIAAEGFESSMTAHFARVDASSDTSCGIALRSGIRTFVNFDVPQHLDPYGSMRLHVEAGLLSAQSTPLISRTGKAIGMVSTHWRTRHRPSDRQLQFLDLLARQAADTIEQRQTTAALRDREAQLALELADMQQLQQISSLLIREDNSDALYEQILDATIALMCSDTGSVQILDPDSHQLRLLTWRGLPPAAVERWQWVNVDMTTSCGTALLSGERASIPDVEACDFLAGTADLDAFRLFGIAAAQSTPLISRHGRLVGMITTHWRTPHQPTSRRLRLLDVLARQVADLLDRKQVEAALAQSEEKNRTILESITDAFLALDEHWNYTYVNSTAEELLLRPPGYLVGKNIWAEYPGLIGSEFEELYRRVAADGVAESLEAFYPDHDRWYEVRVYPVANGLAIYCSNITERKQAEESLAERARELADLNSRLAQSEIQLQERNQELNSFVHIVSHDLKAPLRAVANLSQWIEEDFEGTVSANTTEQMNLLRGRIYRMEGMIDGLLQYARVGRQDIQLELVPVADLLTEVIESIAPPPTFEIDIASQMPTLEANRLLVSQVFANLISNAFKHHDRSDGSIRISSRELDDSYEFAICDDGPGIAPEQRDRVFVIFQAANPQKNPDSTGIGLSIVKKIVETAGGRIWLESELGQGTTFYFTWPNRSAKSSIV